MTGEAPKGWRQGRAQEFARKQLEDYEQPTLNEAKNEALLDFVARREPEIPD